MHFVWFETNENIQLYNSIYFCYCIKIQNEIYAALMSTVQQKQSPVISVSNDYIVHKLVHRPNS